MKGKNGIGTDWRTVEKTEGTILKNNCFKECVLFNFHIHIILNSNLLDILVKDVSQSPENNIIR